MEAVSRSGWSVGGGVVALDREGDDGVETPSASNCFRCSDFCFFNNLSASISARLFSLASKFPVLVVAPDGREENHDMGVANYRPFVILSSFKRVMTVFSFAEFGAVTIPYSGAFGSGRLVDNLVNLDLA